MSSVFIDYKTIRQCYDSSDVIITDVYKKNVTWCDRVFTQPDRGEYITLYVDNCDLILSFNIKSTKVSVGYVSIYGFIISSFYITVGENNYPHLILHSNNHIVELLFEKCCVMEVKMQSVSRSKCDLIKNYMSDNNEYAHRIIKVNDFSPSVTYHSGRLCGHTMCCSLDNTSVIYYMGSSHNTYNLNIVDPEIKLAKINGISKKIIQLLNANDYVIKDIILYMGMIMYHIV